MTPKTLLLTSGIVQRRGASSLGGRSVSSTAAPKRRPEPHDDEQDEKTVPFGEVPAEALDPSVPRFRPGDVIANKYRVDQVLGCGGMAWVLRATHLQLSQTVALKFLRFTATREGIARFFQEGRAAARVSSEAVTRILDVDTLPDGSPFLVMEFLDGRDLEKVVSEPGTLDVPTAVDLTIQACEGLAEVHAAGIVHRDLKPANLFLTRKRNGSIRMKLLDFGISKFAAGGPFDGHESAVTSTQALMGSPVYMAPEQMRSTKNVDGRADIWSLGVILYELLAGGLSPFQGETLPEVCMRVMRETPAPLEAIRADLPAGLAAVVSRCLEKEPKDRFSSAASLALALAPYASYEGQLLARRMQRRPSNPPRAYPALPPVTAPPRRSSAPPREPSATPRESSAAPRLARVERAVPAWAGVALAALVVGVSLASFAAGVSVASRPDSAIASDSAPPPSPGVSMGATIGVTNGMPSTTSPRAPTVFLAPAPSGSGAHVYTPEELPPVPSGRAHTRALPTPRP
jgi:eukaryotic-like serine/threonine-protein kinase